MHERITQLNDLIRDLLGELFTTELALKQGVIVTLSRVDTAPNLRYTRVFVSVFPENERGYAMKTLDHERKSLEKLLHRRLSTRPLPIVSFSLDTTEEKADEIEHLLKVIHEEEGGKSV